MATSHWIANRDITVAHGVKRKEGEHVPEVDDWKDPEHWERAKHIRKVAGPAPVMPGGTGCLHHRMVNGVCAVCAWAAPVPKVVAPKPEPMVVHDAPTEPEPVAITEPSEPAPAVLYDSQPEPEQTKEPVDPPIDGSTLDAEPAEPELAPKYLKGELAKKRKVDLQDIALGLGLAVGDSTKAQIITAIMEAQGA